MILWRLGPVIFLLICLVLQNAPCCAAVRPKYYVPPGGDAERLVDLQTAFKDALREARLVAATFSHCEDTFLRYFQKDHQNFVRDVFRTIANIPLDANINQDNVQQYLAPSNLDVNPDFEKLIISFGDNPGLTNADLRISSCQGPTTGPDAFIFTRPDGSALVSLCPKLFKHPSLDTIMNPPPELRDPPPANTPFIGYTCDRLGDHDTDWMTSPGGVLLHEFMHWGHLLRNIPNIDIWIPDGYITDFPGPNPENGYGPFNAQQLLFLSTKGDPGKFRQNEVLQNADNYAVYAQSKYWSFVCGRTFLEAKGPEDSQQRTGLPLNWDFFGRDRQPPPTIEDRPHKDELLVEAVADDLPLRTLSKGRRRTRKTSGMRVRVEYEVSAGNESLTDN